MKKNKKNIAYIAGAVAVFVLLFAAVSSSGSGGVASVWSALFGSTGNGSLSGAHYELNIIGVPKTKTANMTGDNGHRIFVSLGSKINPIETKIMLSQSTDGSFQVLDANGTDGSATFQLPAPGTYSIFSRALGKVGGTATMTTCGIDSTTGATICSTSNEIFLRDNGKSTFRNVTTSLTSINLDPSLTTLISLCGSATVNLFDSCLQDYFWSYDNSGLKLLQVRFYKL